MNQVKFAAALLLALGVRAVAEPTNQAAMPSNTAVSDGLDQYGDPLPAGAVARLGPRGYRHTGHVLALAFAPNGKTLVGHTGAAALVWDATTGEVRRRLPFPVAVDYEGRMSVSPDGITLAVPEVYPRPKGESQLRISLWDLPSGKKTRSLSMPEEESRAARFAHLGFTADGKYLVVTNMRFGRILVLDLASGQVRIALGGGSCSYFCSIAASPDHKTLAAAVFVQNSDGFIDTTLQLWDLATGKRIRVIPCLPATQDPRLLVKAIAYSSDGKTLALGVEGRIILCDPDTGKTKGQLQAKNIGQISTLAFTDDGKKLLSVSEVDGKVRVWQLATGKIMHTLGGGVYMGRSIAISPDGHTLALGTRGNAVRLWNMESGKELAPEPQAHVSQVKSVAFSPDGKTLATSGDADTLFWETATGQGKGILHGPGGALSFSPDGKHLAMVPANTPRLRIWDLAAREETRGINLPGPGNFISASFSPAGKKLFTLDISNDGKWIIRHWDVATGQQNGLWAIQHQGDSPPTLALDGKTLIFVHQQGGLIVFNVDLDRHRLLARPELARGAYEAIQCLSPDGRLLITAEMTFGTGTARLRVWEMVTGKEIFTLKEQQRTVSTRAMSPDGRLVALGSKGFDQAVRLWDTATGKQLAYFGGIQADVTALSFAPQGTSLAAGLHDGSILIYKVVRSGPGSPSPPKLNLDDLETRWTELAGDDAGKAHRAIWALVAAPKQSVPFLQGRLKPVALSNMAKFQQWIADLDSPKFSVRQAATKELEASAGQFAAPIKSALKQNLSLETRRRLQHILNTLDVPAPHTVRTIRAIMALERIGSREAQNILRTLAGGAPEAYETEEAKASLERLARRAGK